MLPVCFEESYPVCRKLPEKLQIWRLKYLLRKLRIVFLPDLVSFLNLAGVSFGSGTGFEVLDLIKVVEFSFSLLEVSIFLFFRQNMQRLVRYQQNMQRLVNPSNRPSDFVWIWRLFFWRVHNFWKPLRGSPTPYGDLRSPFGDLRTPYGDLRIPLVYLQKGENRMITLGHKLIAQLAERTCNK